MVNYSIHKFNSRFMSGSKFIGAGLATIALAGVGAGIGTVFSALITSVALPSDVSDILPEIVPYILKKGSLVPSEMESITG